MRVAMRANKKVRTLYGKARKMVRCFFRNQAKQCYITAVASHSFTLGTLLGSLPGSLTCYLQRVMCVTDRLTDGINIRYGYNYQRLVTRTAGTNMHGQHFAPPYGQPRLTPPVQTCLIRCCRTSERGNDVKKRYPAGTQKILPMALVMALSGLNTFAQDPVYSQAFLSPIYLNPAATGCGEYDLRVSGIYRRQWWSIPSSMNYMAFSVDKFVPAMSGGVGLIATHSSEGYLNKSGIYASYAYNICSGTKSIAQNGEAPKWFWTGGLQFGWAQTKINYSKLVFADQLDVNGFIPGSVSSANPPINNGRLFPDFAAGTFFNYNINDNNRFLAGLSAHHLNTPDESLTFSGDSIRSQLPVRWTANILYTHTNPSQTWSYTLAGISYRQAYSRSYQIGAEVTQNEFDISLGMWYRGNVNFKEVNTFSLTLAINLAGGSNGKDKIRVGVGHDAEVGSKAYSYTTGSTEMGFVWDHSTYNQSANDPCKPKISSTICPAYVR